MVFGAPDVVKAQIFGSAHAVELFSDDLVFAFISSRMFKEMQHAKFHMSFLASLYRDKSDAFAMPLILGNQHERRELSITVSAPGGVSFCSCPRKFDPRESVVLRSVTLSGKGPGLHHLDAGETATMSEPQGLHPQLRVSSRYDGVGAVG